MARRKRASMREGPLADLFRSTSEGESDPSAGRGAEPPPPEGEAAEDAPAPSTPAASAGWGGDDLFVDEPRREDPASEEETTVYEDAPEPGPTEIAEPPSALEPADAVFDYSSEPEADLSASSYEEPITEEPVRHAPGEPSYEPDLRDYRTEEDEPSQGPVPAAKDRLKSIFAEKPQTREEPDYPAYGRDEPGSGRMPLVPDVSTPMIRVVGVGGAGVNAVNRMVEAGLPSIEFMAVNTDLQSLQQSTADVTVHIGNSVTRGLGSGSDPKLGFQAAFEEQDRIKRLLKGSDLVFVAAGAGGGTGTGAAPVVARLARDVGALTVGICTRPFGFEGTRRAKQAEEGIEALAAEVDTLIVIPNERLLSVLARNTSMVEAFRVADDVLRQGVQGISELVTLPGMINLDFADVRSTMREAGQALLGIGMGTGDNRAVFAAERAVSSPLLETSVDGARSILLSITGGPDLSLVEVSEAARVVQEAAHPDANIIFGANIDDDLTEQVWVTVIATRFDGTGRPAERGDAAAQHHEAGRAARRTREPTRVSSAPARAQRSTDLGIDVPEFMPRN